MAQEVKINGALYPDVPSIRVPDSNDAFHSFIDVSDTTTVSSDVVANKMFYTADGTATNGTLVIKKYYTGSSAPSSSLGNNGDIYIQI